MTRCSRRQLQAASATYATSPSPMRRLDSSDQQHTTQTDYSLYMLEIIVLAPGTIYHYRIINIIIIHIRDYHYVDIIHTFYYTGVIFITNFLNTK